MTAIYTELIAQIKTILQGITMTIDVEGVPTETPRFEQIIARPDIDIESYPAVMFFPNKADNSFDNPQQNFKVYSFKLYIIAGVQQTDLEFLFETVLPNSVDSVLQAFDTNWSLNSINGHRVWVKANVVDWVNSKTEKGNEAIAELDLEIKMLTNN